MLYHLCEALRVVGIVLKAFLPETADRILADLGANTDADFTYARFGVLKGGEKITKNNPIFQRINLNTELAELDKLAESLKEKKEEKKTEEKKVEEVKTETKPEITIDDFDKVELKVGKILTAEKVEKSKKLLHFTVDTGDRVRSIVSGVAKFFTPEEMVGKEVVVVTNLKPATLGGVLSEGMILFGESADGTLATVEPTKPLGGGSTVC